MIDKTKRTTLKALSSLTAVAAIPSGIASASTLLETGDSNATVLGTDVTMSIVPDHGRGHTIQLNNTSNKTVTIKHVYPGIVCLLYTSPSPRDLSTSRMPSSA